MKNTIKTFVLLVGFCFLSSLTFAQIAIDREVLLQLPPELSYGLLGMRISAGKVVMMNNLGRMISYDLVTGESFAGRIRGQRLIDFDLVLGQPIYLTEEGMLGGQIQPAWPKKAFAACRIETGEQGLSLIGGEKMIFLAENATQTVEVKGLNFVLPVAEGFLWSMGLPQKNGCWSLSLFDCFGNLMKDIYQFSPEFAPSGLEIGPLGEEGEVLVSCYENNRRKISLIGQNGHMIWKIDGSEKLCPRDLAFDGSGNLLVIEKSGSGTVLSRWKFAAPQG